MQRGRLLAILLTGAVMSATGVRADDGSGHSSPAAETAPPTNAPAAPDKSPAAAVAVINSSEADGILGREVRSPTNEDMGHIVDVIVDRGGVTRGAVIDFGGFLGVGSRKIVVDWNALHFDRGATKTDSITLALTKEQVTAAPEYRADAPIVVLGLAGSLKPLQFNP